jgi:hypothetical protein
VGIFFLKLDTSVVQENDDAMCSWISTQYNLYIPFSWQGHDGESYPPCKLFSDQCFMFKPKSFLFHSEYNLTASRCKMAYQFELVPFVTILGSLLVFQSISLQIIMVEIKTYTCFTV